MVFAFLAGLLVYVVIKVFVRALYTVKPNERAVLTSFGRAVRLADQWVENDSLNEDERERYRFPQLRVIGPAGPTSSGLGKRCTRSTWPRSRST